MSLNHDPDPLRPATPYEFPTTATSGSKCWICQVCGTRTDEAEMQGHADNCQEPRPAEPALPGEMEAALAHLVSTASRFNFVSTEARAKECEQKIRSRLTTLTAERDAARAAHEQTTRFAVALLSSGCERHAEIAGKEAFSDYFKRRRGCAECREEALTAERDALAERVRELESKHD